MAGLSEKELSQMRVFNNKLRSNASSAMLTRFEVKQLLDHIDAITEANEELKKCVLVRTKEPKILQAWGSLCGLAQHESETVEDFKKRIIASFENGL